MTWSQCFLLISPETLRRRRRTSLKYYFSVFLTQCSILNQPPNMDSSTPQLKIVPNLFLFDYNYSVCIRKCTIQCLHYWTWAADASQRLNACFKHQWRLFTAHIKCQSRSFSPMQKCRPPVRGCVTAVWQLSFPSHSRGKPKTSFYIDNWKLLRARLVIMSLCRTCVDALYSVLLASGWLTVSRCEDVLLPSTQRWLAERLKAVYDEVHGDHCWEMSKCMHGHTLKGKKKKKKLI